MARKRIDVTQETVPTAPARAVVVDGISNNSSIVGKVSFGDIKAKTTKVKVDYPVMESSSDMKKVVDWLAEKAELVAQIATAKAQLAAIATEFYFRNGSGQVEVPSTVIIPGTTVDVGVTFSDSYGKIDEAGVVAVLGQEQAGRMFRQSFTIEVDGDKIPAAKAQALINEIMVLFEKHESAEALAVKDGQVPVQEFHASRHFKLTVAQNLALHAGAAKCTASVKLRKK